MAKSTAAPAITGAPAPASRGTAPAVPARFTPLPAQQVDPGFSPGAGSNPADWASRLSGSQRDAYAVLVGLFTSYGLASLAPKIFDYVKQGYGADAISLLLQNTAEYKQRFAANELRQKAGLRVLQPSEYLALEDSYRQYMAQAGLPKGFYDQPADFTKWIADDVSPSEVKSRVDLATQATSQANPAYKEALQQMYGVSNKDLVAYFLDDSRALPILEKQAAAASIGAAALQRGFAPSQYAEQFATEGVTAADAQKGYAYIANTFQTIRDIASRYGTTWTQGEAERDVFEPGMTPGGAGTESSTQKRQRLTQEERGLFSGAPGASVGGLSARPGF